MPILQTRTLECGHERTLLGPLDFEIEAGAFVLVEGPNGIGKSTLLETLVGLVPPIAGSFEWSIDLADRRFVPQVRTLDPVLPATVSDVVATGSQRGNKIGSMRVSMSNEAVVGALDRVGMEDRSDDLFRELSEGQKQLVLLARALAESPKAVVLDEPAASMDPDKERRAFDLLVRDREARNLTVLVVAHGSRAAQEAADITIHIDDDRNVELLRTD